MSKELSPKRGHLQLHVESLSLSFLPYTFDQKLFPVELISPAGVGDMSLLVILHFNFILEAFLLSHPSLVLRQLISELEWSPQGHLCFRISHFVKSGTGMNAGLLSLRAACICSPVSMHPQRG